MTTETPCEAWLRKLQTSFCTVDQHTSDIECAKNEKISAKILQWRNLFFKFFSRQMPLLPHHF